MALARFVPHPSPAFAARSTPAHVLQNAAVVAAVLALHGVALWALQNGLAERATPPALALPRVITAQLIAAAAPVPVPAPAEIPKPVPPPPAEPSAPVAAPAPVPRQVKPVQPRTETKAPQRKPVIKRPVPPVPAPAMPEPPEATATPVPVNPAPAPAATAAAPAPAASAPAAETTAAPAPPPRTVLPSSSAAYLNNPPPPYPPLARRLGESGEVIVRVLIGTNGRAEKAQIDKSSGYERLDQAALETARDRWRYVPGTRGGVPEAMWFKVPIKFVLE